MVIKTMNLSNLQSRLWLAWRLNRKSIVQFLYSKISWSFQNLQIPLLSMVISLQSFFMVNQVNLQGPSIETLIYINHGFFLKHLFKWDDVLTNSSTKKPQLHSSANSLISQLNDEWSHLYSP